MTRRGDFCRRDFLLGMSVLVVGAGPMSAALQSGLPELPPLRPEIGSHVDDLRFHRGDWAEVARDFLADEPGAGMPRSTTILKRFIEREGTVRTEFYSLLLTHRGHRVRYSQSIDFTTCEIRGELAFLQPQGRKETLGIRSALMHCYGTLEAMWSRFGVAAKRGPEAVKDVASTGPLTIETSSLRTVVSREEWEREGHPDIASSLSAAFLRVMEDEVVSLPQHDPGLAEICRFLGGLRVGECPGLAGTPGANAMGPPDCGFDAEFDVPCTPEQQRAFDARHGADNLAGR